MLFSKSVLYFKSLYYFAHFLFMLFLKYKFLEKIIYLLKLKKINLAIFMCDIFFKRITRF